MKELILILLLIHGLVNCHSQDFVTIKNENIHFEIKGSGEPWIVLVTGIGRAMNDLDSIYYELSTKSTVLRYSRAGLGKSSFNNRKADFDETIDELSKLIDKLNVPEPFILSGHSYGGLIIRAYAKQNPIKVAGLISLDPNFENYFEVLEPLNPKTREIVASLLDNLYNDFPDRGNGYELEATIKIWNSPKRWNDWFNYPSTIPHFLISSLKITDSQLRGTKEMVDARYQAQQRTIENSKTRMQLGITDAGHSVYSDQPQLVVDAFSMLLNVIKTANKR